MDTDSPQSWDEIEMPIWSRGIPNLGEFSLEWLTLWRSMVLDIAFAFAVPPELLKPSQSSHLAPPAIGDDSRMAWSRGDEEVE